MHKKLHPSSLYLYLHYFTPISLLHLFLTQSMTGTSQWRHVCHSYFTVEAGSGLTKNKAIVDKYNKFSQMFMKGKVLSQGVEGDSRKARRATELSELNKEPEPAYLPLRLGHTGGALEPIKEEEEGVSAFAKSAFAVKKSALPAALPQAAMTSEKLLSGLLSAFPSPQRAMSCFLADLTSLDALSVVAQRAAVSAGDGIGWLLLESLIVNFLLRYSSGQRLLLLLVLILVLLLLVLVLLLLALPIDRAPVTILLLRFICSLLTLSNFESSIAFHLSDAFCYILFL